MGDMDSLKASVATKQSGQQTNINFKKGPPTFNKSKNALNQQEFPDFGDNSTKKSDEPAVSKKDGTYSGHFGASFSTGQPKPKPVEEVKEEKEAKKPPVFTRKIKVTTEDSQQVENIPKQQNYDFSKMNMSHASSKATGPRPEGDTKEQREQREPREHREPREPREHHERGSRGERGRGRGGFERGGDRPKKEDSGSEDSFEEVKERRKPQFHRGSKPIKE